MIEPPCLQAIHTPDFAAINRCINAAYPMTNRPLTWGQEGSPSYDCKGFVALKVKALHDRGIPYEAMTILIVDNGTKITDHAVLEYQGAVMDDASPWLERRWEYKVLRTIGSVFAISAITHRNTAPWIDAKSFNPPE